LKESQKYLKEKNKVKERRKYAKKERERKRKTLHLLPLFHIKNPSHSLTTFKYHYP
jgi:hypothetical protein